MRGASEQDPSAHRSVSAGVCVVTGRDSGSRSGSGSSGSVSSTFRCTCSMHYVLAGASNIALGVGACSRRTCAGMRAQELREDILRTS